MPVAESCSKVGKICLRAIGPRLGIGPPSRKVPAAAGWMKDLWQVKRAVEGHHLPSSVLKRMMRTLHYSLGSILWQDR